MALGKQSCFHSLPPDLIRQWSGEMFVVMPNAYQRRPNSNAIIDTPISRRYLTSDTSIH